MSSCTGRVVPKVSTSLSFSNPVNTRPLVLLFQSVHVCQSRVGSPRPSDSDRRRFCRVHVEDQRDQCQGRSTLIVKVFFSVYVYFSRRSSLTSSGIGTVDVEVPPWWALPELVSCCHFKSPHNKPTISFPPSSGHTDSSKICALHEHDSTPVPGIFDGIEWTRWTGVMVDLP